MLRRWFLNVIIIMIVAHFLAGVRYDGIISLVAAGAILGLANVSIRPLLVLITLPLNIITLGLFTFVIGALVLLLTALLVPGFSIAGFGVAMVAALLITLVNLVLASVLR